MARMKEIGIEMVKEENMQKMDLPILSSVPDLSDAPLAEEVTVDSLEYMRIMRRIGLADTETATPVSAFNSSI